MGTVFVHLSSGDAMPVPGWLVARQAGPWPCAVWGSADGPERVCRLASRWAKGRQTWGAAAGGGRWAPGCGRYQKRPNRSCVACQTGGEKGQARPFWQMRLGDQRVPERPQLGELQVGMVVWLGRKAQARSCASHCSTGKAPGSTGATDTGKLAQMKDWPSRICSSPCHACTLQKCRRTSACG